LRRQDSARSVRPYKAAPAAKSTGNLGACRASRDARVHVVTESPLAKKWPVGQIRLDRAVARCSAGALRAETSRPGARNRDGGSLQVEEACAGPKLLRRRRSKCGRRPSYLLLSEVAACDSVPRNRALTASRERRISFLTASKAGKKSLSWACFHCFNSEICL